jgi:putative DNA primase/helicase
MDNVACKDAELRDFLQRWFGYCLTGDVGEHSLLFCYGVGGNGKGVTLNTIATIMGDYAKIAAMDTFTASKGDKHPTDLAGLRGARMVLASETEEGRAWDEQRVKSITGGDPISARFMRQDYFTFRPEFKPIIYGNHKPSLRNVDDAMRRRLKLAPFAWKPPKVVVNFDQQLIPEYPAILRWMIDGCREWLKQGLAPPKSVQAATDTYFADQDVLGRWVDDCCDIGREHAERGGKLFDSWKAFCHANGEEPGSTKPLQGRTGETRSAVGPTSRRQVPRPRLPRHSPEAR